MTSDKPKRLTDITIKNLKPKDKPYEVSDPGARGLRVVVWPEGKKPFIVRYRRPNGKSAKLTLGEMPLTTARTLAGEAFDKLRRGIDPGEEKKSDKRKAAEAAADTVAHICAEYMAHPKTKATLRTYEKRRRQLELYILPVLGTRPITSVTKTDCIRLFDKIARERGPVIADHIRAILGRIFTWHEGRHDTFQSPITRGIEHHAKSPKDRARTRTLTDDELRAVWRATGDNKPFSVLVRFLLLTGARLNEGARLPRSEINGSDWLLPAARNKVKTELLRPLCTAAQAIVNERPRFDGCNYVFTNDGRTAISGFSLPKKQLLEDSGTSNWTLHDLRRTARLLMSRGGVISEIAEKCLGHVAKGIVATYDRYEYYEEKRIAFEKLATQLDLIINPPASNVVPLAG
jgi:hypothetical protein